MKNLYSALIQALICQTCPCTSSLWGMRSILKGLSNSRALTGVLSTGFWARQGPEDGSGRRRRGWKGAGPGMER